MTNLRSVLKFNKTLGVTLPKKYCEKIGLHWKDYVIVFMADDKTISLMKHEVRK